MSDLSKNDDKDLETHDRWVYRGQEYDLTEFAKKHPGGSHYIDLTRGSDITVLVTTYHPMMSQKRVLGHISKMAVGDATVDSDEGDDTVDSDEGSPLFTELQEALINYVTFNGSKGVDHIGWVMFYASWMFALFYYGFKFMAHGFFIDGIITGASMWFVCADAAHSGSHSSILHKPKHNTMLSRTLGSLFSTSSQWLRQHVVSHHVKINTKSDPDIWHHPGAALPWRVCEQTPWRKSYSKWRWSLLATGWMTQIVPNIYYTLEMLIRDRYPPSKQRVVWTKNEYTRAILEIMSNILLVSALFLRHGVQLCLLPNATCGCLYYIFSQVSHINTQLHVPQGSEWAIEQMCHCSGDWGCGSIPASLFSIGLNNQGIHHLFPTVHHAHHTKLMRAFRPILEKHGVYNNQIERGLVESIKGHLERLEELNKWREPVILRPKPMPCDSDSDDETPPE